MRPAPRTGRTPGHVARLDPQLDAQLGVQLAAARRAADRLAQEALVERRLRHLLEQRRLSRDMRRAGST